MKFQSDDFNTDEDFIIIKRREERELDEEL
jgi:hypothetical protein